MKTPQVYRLEFLQGTLDLLILRTLLSGPSHGHAIAKEIKRTSEEVLQVETGSLYPALHRLEAQRWITPRGKRRIRANVRSITGSRPRGKSNWLRSVPSGISLLAPWREF